MWIPNMKPEKVLKRQVNYYDSKTTTTMQQIKGAVPKTDLTAVLKQLIFLMF